MKTELTKAIEKEMFKHFNDMGKYIVFECQIGFMYGTGERVDAIMYRTFEHDITCFEIKISVADFHSKAKLSFVGNRNYYVMPFDLYEKVKDEIPKEIGVYVFKQNKGYEFLPPHLELIKNAKKQELHYDKELLLASMVRSARNKTNLEVLDCEIHN